MLAETVRSCFSHLECAWCARQYSGREAINVCGCGRPLVARYDLAAVGRRIRPEDFARRPHDLWRYRELLPVLDGANIIGLGEGGTPLLPLRRLGGELGLGEVYLKDEGCNPTGTFKARGLAMAGFDFIGGWLTEINVTSPSAVRQINRVMGVRLEGRLVDWLEWRAGEGARPADA